MTATVIGSGSTFGIISSVYTGGIVYILVSFGNPISRLLVANFFVNRLDRFEHCISGGDIMAVYYGKAGRVVTGICGALYCAATVGGQVSAIGFIVNYFLDVPYLLGVLIGCGIVIVYSTIGGVKAVTATDVLQFAVLIIAIPMVCNVGISMAGGFAGVIDKIPPSLLALPDTPASAINYFFMFIVFTVPFLDPSCTQRILMGKNSEQIRQTFKASAMIETPFFVCVGLIGLLAAATSPNLEPNMAFPHLVNTILPTGLKGLAVAGLLAIVMSSADSYLNSAGITLVHDTFKPLFGRFLDNERRELRLTQIITFLLGTMATVVAFCFDSVMAIMLFSFNFWVPIVVVPLYATLLGFEKLAPRCFIAGSLAGLSVFVLWYFFIERTMGISALIPSMLANAAAFVIAYHYPKISRRWAVAAA
jgi:SSS family solute:Na+ symporter